MTPSSHSQPIAAKTSRNSVPTIGRLTQQETGWVDFAHDLVRFIVEIAQAFKDLHGSPRMRLLGIERRLRLDRSRAASSSLCVSPVHHRSHQDGNAGDRHQAPICSCASKATSPKST
jgi:hypothetical protein